MDRFWSKVKKGDGCWEWQAGRHGRAAKSNKIKYGAFYFNGSMKSAHRVAWILIYGTIPNGLCVLHKCDNPICVNPGHLFLGTQRDNVADMYSKNRSRKSNNGGERNGSAKLTLDQGREIREKYVPRKYTLAMLSDEYGVCFQQVSRIVRGEKWNG